MMRYNSYPSNWQKIITLIISTGTTYFAIQTKHWHDYFGKPHCEVKCSCILRPGNSLTRQVIADSRGFKLCVLVDKVSKRSHRCAIGLFSRARAAAVLTPVSGQCRV